MGRLEGYLSIVTNKQKTSILKLLHPLEWLKPEILQNEKELQKDSTTVKFERPARNQALKRRFDESKNIRIKLETNIVNGIEEVNVMMQSRFYFALIMENSSSRQSFFKGQNPSV